jgi:ATP-binding cassette subfamily C protein
MLELIRKLRYLLTPRERWQAGLLFVLMTGGAVLEMVGVGAIPAFVALLSDPEAARDLPVLGPQIEGLDELAPETLVLYGALVLLAVYLVKNSYLAVLSVIQSRYVFNRQVRIGGKLFAAYLHSPYPFHLQRNTAELLRNANTESMQVVGAGLMPLMMLTMEGLTVTAILLLLLAVEPLASLVALVILGGTTVLFLRLVRRRVQHHGEQIQYRYGKMIQAVNEGLGGIKVTKVLGRERQFLQTYAAHAGLYARAGRVRQVLIEVPRLFLETAAVGGLLGVAVLLLAQGRPSTEIVPTLALLAVAVVRMLPSFNRITGAITMIRFGKFAVGVVHDDLRQLDRGGAGDPAAPLPFHEAIRLDDITYQYPGAAEPSLRGVSLEIPKGSVVGFVGPTGAGKTTLVDVILGLLDPTDGRVLVDGRDLHGREAAWQRQAGYVPQDVYLADDTIRNNVAFGLADADIDETALWRAVDAAQAREFVERLPGGLDTVVGERGVRLSGGQRQRLGIARALYHDPEVLVLDEATSALDHDTERAVMDAVEHLRGSRTILLIAHRISTVQGCDRVVEVARGRVGEGTVPATSLPQKRSEAP